MIVVPSIARIRGSVRPALGRPFRRRWAIGPAVAILLAVGGCVSAPIAAETPPTLEPASTRLELAGGPVRAVIARRLVAGPVRDRLGIGARVLLARGAAVDVIDPDGRRQRVVPGGRTPVVDLELHEGLVHLALRDGRVLRADGDWPPPRFTVLPEPEPEPEPESAGAGVSDAPVTLASLGGVLYRLHGDRVTRWPGAAATTVGASPLRGTVVPGADGPLVTAGRRAFLATTGGFAGSASLLDAAPAGSDWPGRLLYARNPSSGAGVPAEVGAMDGRLREVDRERRRLTFGGAVHGLAFDRGRAAVATADAVHLIDVADGRLRIAASRDLAPGERLWSDGPDRAAILRSDGTLAALPGDQARDDGVVASAMAAERLGGASLPRPEAAAFDGRTLRVRTAAGVLDLDLSGGVGPAAGVEPAAVPDTARMSRSVRTRRGWLALDESGRLGPGAADRGPFDGLAAVDGLAWAAGDGRLVLLDPRDGAQLAAIDVDGRPRWVAPVPGGRGSIILTDAGEAWRFDLERRGGE